MCVMRYFNPRTRMGCDKEMARRLGAGSVFQSTHPHGVRQRLIDYRIVSERFQSTHPHGVRRSSAYLTAVSLNFNPRTRMGCDINLYSQLVQSGQFQSTHPHGVRPFLSTGLSCLKAFQSTHPHGVRRLEAF